MATLIETQDPAANVDKFKAYAGWVLKVQNQQDPNGQDVRTEPKYTIPDGKPYTGAWCRPQTDGPGLRATALIEIGEYLRKNGDSDFVQENLWTGDSSVKNGGAIKYDLDWIVDNWQSEGCDLWEEVRSDDFFWGRMTMKKALQLGSEFATAMGDQASAAKYASVAKDVIRSLPSHWTGTFVKEADNRPQDGAVIVGFNDGYYPRDGLYSPTSKEVAGTIKTLVGSFCAVFPINQQDTQKGVAGVLLGRYPGDNYAGGNPWILTSAALATLLYRGAAEVLAKDGLLEEAALAHWRGVFNLSPKETPSAMELSRLFAAHGDGILERIKYHTQQDGLHMKEQIDKNTGEQVSAANLTWSYAEVIKAVYYRAKYVDLVRDLHLWFEILRVIHYLLEPVCMCGLCYKYVGIFELL